MASDGGYSGEYVVEQEFVIENAIFWTKLDNRLAIFFSFTTVKFKSVQNRSYETGYSAQYTWALRK